MFIFAFFPLFLVIWRSLRGRTLARTSTLLFGSYFFYAWWDYRFTALLAYSSLVNYLGGIAIHRFQSKGTRRGAFVVTLSLLLAPLLFFKYLPWLGSYAAHLLQGTAKLEYASFMSSIVLPVGISFFTFQAMTYAVDLYQGRCRFCKNLIRIATHVCMFPQLLAGPITRFRDMDEQLEKAGALDEHADLAGGAERFFCGLVKKVMLADPISILIEPSFLPGAELNPFLAWASILGYSLQLYFDFSGYSDMAIGIGRCLGFRFPENFSAPYSAKNPSDFWRRWHITLSNWLRDYLYISLGGNRKGRLRTYGNLMLTMLLCGFWHGASWTFMLWGIWHGLMLAIHRASPEILRRLIPGWASMLLLNIAVASGWVLFPASSISLALTL
jgi:alginate O-acetyltransferase complex protein AlgI